MLIISQTYYMPTLKTTQIAFNKAKIAYKTAQDNLSMPGQEKEQMAEQIIALADELVTVAVESVEGGGITDMGTPGEGVVPPEQISTDIPVIEDPDKKLNTAQEDNKDEDKKLTTAQDDNKDEDKNEIKEMRKELDAMKAEKTAIKLAQRYSRLYPMAMRTAMYDAFLSHKESVSLLEARLDEASTILGKQTAQKIAQEDGSVFNFEDLDKPTNTIDTGGKI